MAMLAEPRRRQKLSSDPRNKSWANDEGRFGEQMMKKMGWSRGKGLGLKEDGKTSHIAVTLKNNTCGLGHSQKYDDTWISHQDDFNDLLSSLNQNHGEKEEKKAAAPAPQSLQATAKKAKCRVNYSKFTRGKDLSTYSSSQMNCIFGVRSNTGTPSERSRNESENNSDNGSDDEDVQVRVGLGFASSAPVAMPSKEHSFGVQTVTSSSSIQEYFARKMKELQQKRSAEASANGKAVTDSNDTNTTDSPERDTGPGLEESGQGTSDPTEYQEEDVCGKAHTQTKEKKKKKKKKSKKQKQENSDDESQENLGQDNRSSFAEEINSKTATEDAVVQTNERRTKKKKKRKAELAENQQDGDDGDDLRPRSEEDAPKTKRRKMKKKKGEKKKAKRLQENGQNDS